MASALRNAVFAPRAPPAERASRAPVIASPSVAATESKEGEGEPSGVVEEKPLTVTLLEDRWQDPLPYSALLVGRLLRCLCSSNKVKLPRSVLKLLATMARYPRGRAWLLRALLGCLSHGGARAVACVRGLAAEQANPACVAAGEPQSPPEALEADLLLLYEAAEVARSDPLHLRRILCGVSFVFRKTDKLVWYDVMRQPNVGRGEDPAGVWLFGSLLQLLGKPQSASSINLEYVLQVLEELCGLLAKLTVRQANDLANRAVKARGISEGVGQGLQTIQEEEEGADSGRKRHRTDTGSASSSSSSSSSSSVPTTTPAPTSEELEGPSSAPASVPAPSAPSSAPSPAPVPAPVAPLTGSAARATDDVAPEVQVRLMPFPVLGAAEARVLCMVAGSAECGGSARKRLTRCMRSLSLCDANWTLFLDHLAEVGAELAARAAMEFSDLHSTLVEVAQQQESAAAAMARPQLSTPVGLSEVRLLYVLRLMTALRSRTTGEAGAAAAEAEVVAVRVRRIRAGRLWESLCACLDLVRDLEGISDIDMDMEGGKEQGSSAAEEKEQEKAEEKVALSSLTMRFMPLIECFLTVCSTTLLVRPSEEATPLSSGVKRRLEGDAVESMGGGSMPPPLAGTSAGALASPRVYAGRRSPSMIREGPSLDLLSPGQGLIRVNSMLPGSRFRQHPGYWQMQMELADESSAQRLVTFVKQNRVLLNNVLRSNVQLLEGSFSPLVTVPRCRQLLHFDIKRAYFKARLKRMRQSAARQMHGALRLSVRRQRVFEESFQALRYKTAHEMRRRLTVSFHGEEGMDAGGLTREWYSVLAREIFNPNYALFTSPASVTFQPNPQSFVNPDHLSYFKFVGRVIGKAICDGQLLDAHFTRSFYKHMLGLPVSVQDLEAIEPDYFKSLQQLLASPLELLGLDLTFSAESNEFGLVSTVDLIPGGQEIAVTDESKHEYVKLLAHHRMTTAIRRQIDAFLEGFHELVPPELVSLFDAQELELLISGLPDIDLDDLRAHTDYQGYKSADPEIGYFWSVLKSFSQEEKALFLQFVTGTSKVPLDGFAALQGSDGVKRFNIHRSFGGAAQLPSAHTCFNQLDLPEYPTEEATRDKLMIAIREGSEGFGFA